MKYPIYKRHIMAVQFTADIYCDKRSHENLKKGLAIKWAYENKFSMRGTDLRGAIIENTDLKCADFTGADLRGAILKNADLEYSNFNAADLRGICLQNSVLKYANLKSANLNGSVLDGAVLKYADLENAIFLKDTLELTDLRK